MPKAPAEDATPLQGTDNYSFEDRLTKRQSADGSNVRLVYDGDGNLVQQITTRNAVTESVSYLVDTMNPTGYSQVLEEHVNGTVTKVYTFGHDLISQDHRDGTGTFAASFYGYDGHGSVRQLTNELGQPTDSYTYDAFGELIHKTGSTANDYLYCGERYSGGLGLYHLRARFMSTNYGRFWNMDTYEGRSALPISLHKYLYANADPVSFVDPSGLVGDFTLSGEAVKAGVLHMLIRRGVMSATSAYVRANVVAARFQVFVFEHGWKVEAALAYFGGALIAVDGLASLAEGWLANEDRIPAGSRGQFLEDRTNANLRGSFPKIDHFDKSDGHAISIKTHNLSGENSLIAAIRRDLRAMHGIEHEELSGPIHNGRVVTIAKGDIKIKSLLVGVPEHDALIINSGSFRAALRDLVREFRTTIRVVPVPKWQK